MLLTVGTASGNTTFAGVISGGGSLVKDGASTQTLTGANTYTGGTLVSGGVLAGNTTSLLGNITNNALVVFNQATDGTFGGTVSGTGSLLKTNSNTLTLTGSITQGGVNISQGTLQIANGGSLTGSITNNASLVFNRSDDALAPADVISGTGTVTKVGAGTVTLVASNNTYSGTTTVGGGVLIATSLANSGFASSVGTGSTIALNNNGVLRYTGGTVSTDRNFNLLGNGGIGVSNSTTALTVTGVISNTGGLSKFGAGTLILSGANTFTGSTTVSSGTLNLNNATGAALGSTASVSVASGATLLLSQNNQVNDAATITLSGGTIRRQGSAVSEAFGNLNVTSASTLDFGGTTSSMTFSGLDYAPSALLSLQLFNFDYGSTLVINNTSDWGDPTAPGSGFTFGGTGGFGSYSFSNGTFTITAIPEPSTYLAAAGLLALMLWPSRRRLLRDAQKILGLRAPMRDRLAAQREG